MTEVLEMHAPVTASGNVIYEGKQRSEQGHIYV